MSRSLSSLQYGYFHVMLRGNRREAIFFDNADRQKCYEYLSMLVERYDCKIHLFCLMTNHIHLVLETGAIPMPKLIQVLSSSYTRFINHILDLEGHLFQGKYLAKPVLDNRYLLKLCQYIHLNPKIAGLVDDLNDYTWSSHHAYESPIKPKWLTVATIINFLSEWGLSYSELMLRADRQDYSAILTVERSEGDELVALRTLAHAQIHLYATLSLEEMIQCICHEMCIDERLVTSKSRARDVCLIRSLIAYFGHYRAGFSLKAIAIYLRQDPRCLSRSLHRRIEERTIHRHLTSVDSALELLFYKKFNQKNALEGNHN